MSEIEDKRKEFSILMNKRISKTKMYSFDEVREFLEMARKEFLEFLESEEIEDLVKWADIGSCHEKFYYIEDKKKELKQSLEAKEK